MVECSRPSPNSQHQTLSLRTAIDSVAEVWSEPSNADDDEVRTGTTPFRRTPPIGWIVHDLTLHWSGWLLPMRQQPSSRRSKNRSDGSNEKISSHLRFDSSVERIGIKRAIRVKFLGLGLYLSRHIDFLKKTFDYETLVFRVSHHIETFFYPDLS